MTRSKKTTTRTIPVEVVRYDCNGCGKEDITPVIVVQCDPHGYDFCYDDEYHFCCLSCLSAWLETVLTSELDKEPYVKLCKVE